VNYGDPGFVLNTPLTAGPINDTKLLKIFGYHVLSILVQLTSQRI